MKLSELQSYKEVVLYLASENREKHLLFGNGFSIAYDPNIFSYNALSKFIDEIDNDLLKKLFEVINTKNFELVMQQLDNFISSIVWCPHRTNYISLQCDIQSFNY